jgi:hypothetical protein
MNIPIIAPNIVGTVNASELSYIPKDYKGAFILEHNYLNNQDGGCFRINEDGDLMYHGIFRQWVYSSQRNPSDFLYTNRFLSIN